MMAIHLESIRRFYPDAPILVSARDGNVQEMQSHRARFGVRYWLEECNYADALIRLLERAETRYVCVMDHDAVLLSSPDHLLAGLAEGKWDLVGIEERIREPADTAAKDARFRGWLRFAPGYMDATFLMFDWRSFRERWGTRGILAKRPRATVHFEFHYGICEKLTRHKYLLPFHVPGYGFGNLLTDGEHPIAWHQWYGAYRKRLGAVAAPLAEVARSGEQAFLADYPALRLSRAVPAWGPGLDIEIERASLRHVASEGPARWASLRRWYGYGVRGLVSRVLAKLDRWRRLH